MRAGIGVIAARVAIVVALFAIWEILSRTGIVNPRLLPSASDTLATLGDLLQRASVRKDLAVTAMEVVTAFALAVPFGALMFMRANKDASVKLITELYEIPAEIAALEYENTILKLETDGSMEGPKIPEQLQLALDMAKAGGMKDLGPAAEIISTQFKPVPTKP